VGGRRSFFCPEEEVEAEVAVAISRQDGLKSDLVAADGAFVVALLMIVAYVSFSLLFSLIFEGNCEVTSTTLELV
jgi:hypothetical protein